MAIYEQQAKWLDQISNRLKRASDGRGDQKNGSRVIDVTRLPLHIYKGLVNCGVVYSSMPGHMALSGTTSQVSRST